MEGLGAFPYLAASQKKDARHFEIFGGVTASPTRTG